MIPVLTPDEMRAVDAATPVPVEVLVHRAGGAVARAAMRMLDGSGYGRRVIVVAGKGNNGADGRDAAARLRRRGCRVVVVEAADAPAALWFADLVIDAAYGTGFRGEYRAPHPGAAPVLAVDVPSGVDGLTGAACEGAVRAVVTVTFAALKPGLLLGDGPDRAGWVEVVDIGLDVSGASAHVIEPVDVAGLLPQRGRDAHKWRSALLVVAGSAGMAGAAALCTRAAQRAGAGMVRLGSPGLDPGAFAAAEAVGVALPAEGWASAALDAAERCRAIVVGPGLGRASATQTAIRELVDRATIPVVVDADGLFALGERPSLRTSVVLTPHDGEYARLAGTAPAGDRIAGVRDLAAGTGAVVLLKGPTTVVATPDGKVMLSVSADHDGRLATAGTGDVLSGVIGALLAGGTDALGAAAGGAWLHHYAAHLGSSRGLVAGDIPDLMPAAFAAGAAVAAADTEGSGRATGVG